MTDRQGSITRQRRRLFRTLGTVVACAAAVTTTLLLAHPSGAYGSAHRPDARAVPGPLPRSVALARAAPIQVLASTPADGAMGVVGTQPITIDTTAPVDLRARQPSIAPQIPGRWTASARQLTFVPNGAYPPDSLVTVTLPSSLRSVQGASLNRTQTVSFRTGDGSVLRLQQLLAALGYLPLRWTPSAGPAGAPGASAAADQRAVFVPPGGVFTWTWQSVPPSLAATWTPGVDTVMTRGAVMAFEADRHLAVDGVAGQGVWTALAAAQPSSTVGRNPHGYTYAVAAKSSPQTLTVWHDGTIIGHTPANLGIAQAPTADGTFPVYERLATQVMRGTNPDGSAYADPVAWVAYFNGGDAVHYIARSTFGYPQSLGCVEIPYAVGQAVWPSLTLGTLVTVTG